MAIITISRGSYSKGREVAEKVARRLNYTTVSREIILEASKDFNISEVKLIRIMHDAPSMLERFTFTREKFLAYIESLSWITSKRTMLFIMDLPATSSSEILAMYSMCVS